MKKLGKAVASIRAPIAQSVATGGWLERQATPTPSEDELEHARERQQTDEEDKYDNTENDFHQRSSMN